MLYLETRKTLAIFAQKFYSKKEIMEEIKLQAQLNRIEDLVLLGSKTVLTIEDVCALTGLSKGRIYALCSQKVIPHYKQGKLYFKRDEVEAWLTAKRVPTQAEVESKATLYCMEH